MIFISPTDGKLTLNQVYASIMDNVNNNPQAKYKLIIGTDSQASNENILYITAIVFYQIGKGGRYFYNKDKQKNNINFKTRIFNEVSKSLELASQLTIQLIEKENFCNNIDVQIHIDVGEKGATNSIIKEVVGMVIGSGYEAKIKPDSYAASSVADKHTK
ncbi:MAG: ribonuclease H-like YkuK family protein [Candidatus Woesearchaeota archaeon]